MAVAFDNVTEDAAAVSHSFAHTVGTDSARLLILLLGYEATVTTKTVSATYAGAALTRLTGVVNAATGPDAVEVWYLINPATGSNTLVSTGTVGFGNPVKVLSFAGVDQVNPFNAQPTTISTAGSTTPSTSVTSTSAGVLLLDCVLWHDNTSTVTFNGTQTQRGTLQTFSGAARSHTLIASTDGPKSGDASYSMGETISVSAPWVQVLLALNYSTTQFNNFKFPRAGNGISVTEKIR